jgi:hypothetical protein
MTHEARIDALRQQGYTTGQAAVLARVMVHGGYCLRRQVAAATGHADGGMATAFLHGLVARGHARVRRCARRGWLYQITAPRLYAAIGEPDRPSRRRVSLASVLRRLMTLDVVLAHQAWRVLATEREKVDHFTRDRELSPQLVPETWNSGAHRGRGSVRAFPEGGPVLITPQDDGVTFVYVQGPANTVTGWTTFLVAYAPLLTALSRVDVLFATVDPMGFGARAQTVFAAWQRTARQRRETELRRTRAALERLFRLRMAVRSGGVDLLRGWDPHAVRRLGSRQVHPRYAGLYEDWSAAGSRILDRIAAEPRVQVAHVGCRVWALPHRYDLFGTAAARTLCSEPGAASPTRERLHSARQAAA